MWAGAKSLVQRATLKAREATLGVKLVRQSGLLAQLSPRAIGRLGFTATQVRLGPHYAPLLHAFNSPGKLALRDTRHELDYAALERDINRLSRALAAGGVTSGDRVALMLGNSIEHIVAQLAIPRMGAIAVEIGNRLGPAEVSYILSNAEPQTVIYDAGFAATIAAARAKAGSIEDRQLLVCGEGAENCPGSVLGAVMADYPGEAPPSRLRRSREGGVMVYTSGTTGNPKGANRSLSGLSMLSAIDMMLKMGMRHDDRQLVVCPLYHSAAPAFVGMAFALGASCLLLDKFDEELVLGTIAKERITGAFMVPTMLARLADVPSAARAERDTSSLRWVCSGAAPLPPTTAAAFQDAFGHLLWNFYGATETGMVTLAAPHEHASRPGTVGRALEGNDLAVLDEDGNDVGRGEIGEIYARNGMLIRGYHRNPDATDKSMRRGFFSVGDLGRLDEHGYLYLESRTHDMVISGGVNIYPREIENHLMKHPQIADAAVIGIPDDVWGESLKAFIVTRGSAMSEDEVIRGCLEGLADYKRPRSVAFVDELPRNATGKVLKRALRDL